MSELVAHKADVTIPVYGTIADAEVYLKSEADKVIAEKDKEIAELKADIPNNLLPADVQNQLAGKHHDAVMTLSLVSEDR